MVNDEPSQSSETLSVQMPQGSSQKLSDITNAIKALHEESVQIAELSEMERAYLMEITSNMKQVLEPLDASFHIKPSLISMNDNSINDAILTSEGMLFLVHNNGLVSSRPMEDLNSESLLLVLGETVPQVKTMLIEKRQKLSNHVTIFERIAKEFRKLSSILTTRAKPEVQAPARVSTPQEAMKTALTKPAGQS